MCADTVQDKQQKNGDDILVPVPNKPGSTLETESVCEEDGLSHDERNDANGGEGIGLSFEEQKQKLIMEIETEEENVKKIEEICKKYQSSPLIQAVCFIFFLIFIHHFVSLF